MLSCFESIFPMLKKDIRDLKIQKQRARGYGFGEKKTNGRVGMCMDTLLSLVVFFILHDRTLGRIICAVKGYHLFLLWRTCPSNIQIIQISMKRFIIILSSYPFFTFFISRLPHDKLLSFALDFNKFDQFICTSKSLIETEKKLSELQSECTKLFGFSIPLSSTPLITYRRNP